MSRFCPNCGRELAENAASCEGCGVKLTPWGGESLFERSAPSAETPASEIPLPAPLAVPTAEAPSAEPSSAIPGYSPAPASAIPETAPVQPCPGMVSGEVTLIPMTAAGPSVWLKKHWPILAGAAAFIVIVLVLLLILLSGGSARNAVNRYYKVIVDPDEKAVRELAPEEFWSYIDDRYDGVGPAEAVEKYEEQLTNMEDEYGENIRVKCDILKEKDVSSKILGEIKTSLKDRYGILKKDVDGAVKLLVDLELEGADDEDEEDVTVYAVQIKGSWYVIEESGSDWTFLQDFVSSLGYSYFIYD